MNKNFYIANIFVVSCLALSGCVTPPPNIQIQQMPTKYSFIYQGIDFGHDRNEDYKQGVIDACFTAEGNYTKNHDKFNLNKSYNIGWKNGRLKCKGSK